jgi:hypothetical protein
MNVNSTEDLLVKYAYNDVSISEKHLIEQALDESWELTELYHTLTKARKALPKAEFSPRNSTIQSILKYNREQAALAPQL